MVLGRSGYDVNICFQSRAGHSLRTAIASTSVDREILRTNLQDLPVFFEPHASPEFYRIAKIIRLDLAAPAEFVQPSTVYSCYGAADANHCRFRRNLRSQLRFVQRKANAGGQGAWIREPRAAPSLYRRFAITEKFDGVFVQRANNNAGERTAKIQSNCQ